MNKFIIITLGCKVNQCESELLAESLKASGWSCCEKGADLCIVNTCTVTQKASMQSRQAIRQIIRANPGARVIVTGCYAQIEADEIRKIQGVSEVILRDFNKAAGFEIQNSKLLSALKLSLPPSRIPDTAFRTRPFLKIQDGCNAFCTYCIVPYTRGRSRSMPPETVLEHIRRLGAAGFCEVVLSGIHLGCYGLDLFPPVNLAALLHRICETKIVKRLRLSSVEPNELNEEIISLAAASDYICKHFHIPLQSGDDRILERMHRPYTAAFFKELATKIHEQIPDAAVGVDTLIGFPGENEAAFRNTYRLIEQLPVSYLHVFPFSPRKGTPAFTYPDKIPSKIITARCRDMRELGKVKRQEFYKKFIGKSLEVLVESRRDKSTGLLKSISSNYIPVLLTGKDDLKNRLVNVRIEEINGKNTVFGSLEEG